MPIREQHASIISSSHDDDADADDAVSSEVVVTRVRAAGLVGLDTLSTEGDDDHDDNDDDWRACLLSTSKKQRTSSGRRSKSSSGAAVSALSSLLSSYGSDEEEQEEEAIDKSNTDDGNDDREEGDDDREGGDKCSREDDVPALGRMLAFHAVQCTIGNRSFRLHLSPPSASACCSTNMNMNRGWTTHSTTTATTKYRGLFYEEIK
jgi:hypothetical protein